MIRRYRFIFAALFVLYVAAQLVSYGLAGKKNLGWFEKAIVVIATPGQRLISATGGAISQIWNHYFNLVDAAKDNERLKIVVSELQSRLISAREQEQEVQRLRAAMDMPNRFFVKVTGAERIASGTSTYQRVIRVRHASDQTLIPGMAVISPQGVVGQIYTASSDVADILLIIDKASALDVVDQRSRAVGVLKGHDMDKLRFEYAKRGMDVQVGDEILTSGLDGVYQKGIPVGIVTDVGKDPKQLYMEAYVKPHVDFTTLEEVGIVTKLLPIPPSASSANVTVAPIVNVTPLVPATPSAEPTIKPTATPKPKPKVTPKPTPVETPLGEDMPELPMAEEVLIP